MANEEARKITIVGGSGTVGAPTVRALLDKHIHQVTILSRHESSATFPNEARVLKGSYDDASFLEDSLQGQDVLVIQIGFTSDASVQSNLIRAAARAGVPWILPCEFGSDSDNDKLVNEVTLMQDKRAYRTLIENLGVSSWIGIVNNPWFDFSLKTGFFGIDIPEKRAKIFQGGIAKANTSTTKRVGQSVAGLLSLPHDELARFRNSWAYISSFHVAQTDILDAVIRATQTSRQDWSIEHVDLLEYIDNGKEQLRRGNYGAGVQVLYGTVFRKGFGGSYQETQPLLNELLQLPQEDIDEIVRGIIGQNIE